MVEVRGLFLLDHILEDDIVGLRNLDSEQIIFVPKNKAVEQKIRGSHRE